MVIWLLGISGAGKTTVGLELKKRLKDAYMLDGDEVRELFGNDLGYTAAEREAHIKRIILAAYALDKNKVNTIVCCITPFQKLRDICRHKIAGYSEIYLKRELDSSIKNDVKQMYAQNKGKTAVVGVDIVFEEPLCPDLTLDTDKLTVAETVAAIMAHIVGKYGTECLNE
ncbi:MAG: adenylyl-sulfate kinase [Lachnospiraceae bacterium]|jgi:adenylylsulfate kinase|nr:adenylyl-sulfate kinase [Lachnospiraceae bacterium]